MVAIGISEFTFGFAFLHEQAHRNWGDLRAVPILPNLRQEADAGWDAQLPLSGTDFYYQFKLSDYLSRSYATFIKDGTFDGPYYRIWLHRRDSSRQHRRLRQHAQTHSHTYYAAPEVNNIEDFNTAFLGNEMTERSRLIPLGECEDINDTEQHCIVFREGSLHWEQRSERKGSFKSFFGKNLGDLYRDTRREWRTIDLGFAAETLEKTVSAVREVISVEERPRQAPPLLDLQVGGNTRSELLIRTSQILSVVFGVTMVIVGERGQ